MGQIQNVSPDMKEAIRRKSAYMLPNNPTEAGWKADDIRKAFYEAIIGTKDSLLAEIERVISEANKSFFEADLLEDGAVEYKVTANGTNPYQIANMGAVQNVANGILITIKQYVDEKISKTVIDYITALIAGAPESFDTLKEISDWIKEHEDDAASMNSSIQEIKKSVPKIVRLI